MCILKPLEKKQIIRTYLRLRRFGSDYISLVRVKGVEPLRLAAQEPKGDVTLVKVFKWRRL